MTVRAALAVAVLGAAAAPARADEPCTVNALDCLAIDQFSATADATSDALFVTALASPVAMELGRGLDDDSVRRGGAYATAVGATAIVAGLTKITVRRARPYTYNRHPDVVAYTAAAHGNRHSFFSGHTSLSFAAMTSGAMLHSATSTSEQTRLVLWAGAGAVAAATGVLRIRAGQHFPTDVAVGAAIGIGLGLGLTAVVEPKTELRATDVGMLAAGVAVGTLAAAVVPMRKDVRVPLGLRSLTLVPTVAPGQAGLSIVAIR